MYRCKYLIDVTHRKWKHTFWIRLNSSWGCFLLPVSETNTTWCLPSNVSHSTSRTVEEIIWLNRTREGFIYLTVVSLDFSLWSCGCIECLNDFCWDIRSEAAVIVLISSFTQTHQTHTLFSVLANRKSREFFFLPLVFWDRLNPKQTDWHLFKNPEKDHRRRLKFEEFLWIPRCRPLHQKQMCHFLGLELKPCLVTISV